MTSKFTQQEMDEFNEYLAEERRQRAILLEHLQAIVRGEDYSPPPPDEKSLQKMRDRITREPALGDDCRAIANAMDFHQVCGLKACARSKHCTTPFVECVLVTSEALSFELTPMADRVREKARAR